jgi:hypothetical protein
MGNKTGKRNILIGSVVIIVILVIIGIIKPIVSVIIKEMQKEPKPNIFLERHAPWLIKRQTESQVVGIYVYTDENYNPANYRVTRKSLSRTFDGGKTWTVIWKIENDSPKIIHCMKACKCRKLPPNHRDIIIFIKDY